MQSRLSFNVIIVTCKRENEPNVHDIFATRCWEDEHRGDPNEKCRNKRNPLGIAWSLSGLSTSSTFPSTTYNHFRQCGNASGFNVSPHLSESVRADAKLKIIMMVVLMMMMMMWMSKKNQKSWWRQTVNYKLQTFFSDNVAELSSKHKLQQSHMAYAQILIFD